MQTTIYLPFGAWVNILDHQYGVPSGENVVIPLNKINKFLGNVKNNVVLTVTGSTAPGKAFVYWR